MNLYELLKDVVFDDDVKFVSQDLDGVINTYNDHPSEFFTDDYWTSRNFIGYLQDSNFEDMVFDVAVDSRYALLPVVEGKVQYALPEDVAGKVTINLTDSDFEYLMDELEVAEMILGTVNQILKERGVNIKFDVNFEYN